jgi:hypothetical protein
MDSAELTAYVDAACKAQGLALTPDQRARVIEHFARIAAMTEAVVDFPLGPEDEQAQVFRA